MDPTLESLAFLYLTIAHSADGAITGDEMRTLANSLRAWNPEGSLESIGEVLRKTVDEYKQLAGHDAKVERADRCTEQLAGALGPDDRRRVIDALRGIADADGKITPDEVAFIERIQGRFAAS